MTATVPLPDAPWPEGTDPAVIAKSELQSQVRDATEWATNSDPSQGGFVHMELYRRIQEWVKNPDALEIIDGILQQRLTMAFPANHKALFLTQLIPRDSLAPYAPLLKPLSEPPPDAAGANFNFLITTLAASLHTLADLEAKNVEAKKKADEEAKKKAEEDALWERTAELYGWGSRPEMWYGGYAGGYGPYPMPGAYAPIPLPEAAPPEPPKKKVSWFPPISQDDWWVGKGGPDAKPA
ncbi:hypothetical protein L202_07136 [Cryptococcus amylolentus CBS 6039]|uniref:Uncharacterized protein n=2 Tax=Cryptococcus amylolentus TaxID=104669 RepID=A0A1E3HFC4_9TREE|nr:hypothetical protein L202_07136 [Cryptococcus amylolentus CBS 6039]ODN74825.1 hypothetical protein L202_07136 [Cryptococcus amylolentus CBS 6039]ODO01731.1 hypothetical protein I350_06559 [Cryptococcus amylolentus CBS 6273]